MKSLRLLKKAVFEKLNNDITLRNLLGGEGHIVHGQPLKNTLYPCVVYRIITDTDFPYDESSGASTITRSYIGINIITAESKTENSDEIESRIKELLHGQRTLDTDEIICYSCYRENLVEPLRDDVLLTWITPVRYRTSWAVK